MNVVVLVDFENDSVRTALEVADALGDACGACGSTHRRSWWTARSGTRWVTSTRPASTPSSSAASGTRSTVPGTSGSKIVASGGFDAERIREFEALGAPVDSYGVGSSLVRGANDFTADVVRVEGRDCAKAGRGYRSNPRLEPVA